MEIDWSDLQSKLQNIIDESISQTDDTLSKEIASLTSMSQGEVESLFPEAADQETLVELMTTVKGAQTRNDKINSIFSNAQKFGSVVVTLLDRL